jgi:hypothetical protein
VLVAKFPTVPLPPDPSPCVSRGQEGEDGGEPDVDRTVYETSVGDFRGYYQDGAYISYPDGHWDDDQDEGSNKSENDQASDPSESGEDHPRNSSADEIRDAYFNSITNRYTSLRNLLQTDPPDTAVRALPPTNPVKVAQWKRGVGSFRTWEDRLRGTDPVPVQIASMHKDSVFRLLRIILAGKFLRKRQELRERTSRWIWALLARLPNKGELDYQEVGWIRELGKRAVLMLVSLTELELLREHCDVAKSSPDEDEYEVDADVDECVEEDLDQDTPLYVDGPSSLITTEQQLYETKQPEVSATNKDIGQPPSDTTDNDHASSSVVVDTKSSKDSSDVEMQLDSDTEDGEVTDDPLSLPSPRPESDPTADVEAAKERLLAQLDGDSTTDYRVEADVAQEQGDYEATGAAESEEEDGSCQRYEEMDRGKSNERATLNMILTVAGEFYGQRDLLEFRNPFGGLQFG